ncbi:MAG: heparin-binding hemagglutinin [Mycobacteriaceae bacterium]|nr:heparin-binding hemagglutinin [Mycobacteriaceae bacterium]
MPNTTTTVTKPLYATVGAADRLYEAIVESYDQVRDRAEVNARVEKLRGQLANLPAELQDQLQTLRERVAKLPEVPEEVTELRARLAPEELRKSADSYLKSAIDLYEELAGRGEQTVERLRHDERVERAEGLYRDALGLAQDTVGKVVNAVSGTAAEAEETVEATVVEAEPAPKAPRAKKAAKPKAAEPEA